MCVHVTLGVAEPGYKLSIKYVDWILVSLSKFFFFLALHNP